DFPAAPVIIGMILGPLAEQNFRQAMTISAGDWTVFFTRPLSATILALAALALFGPKLYQLAMRPKPDHVPRDACVTNRVFRTGPGARATRSVATRGEQFWTVLPLLGLGHQQPGHDKSGAADAGKAEEGDAAAEPVAHPSGERRTQRSSDPGRAAHNSLRQIETPRAARDVGDRQWNQHADH